MDQRTDRHPLIEMRGRILKDWGKRFPSRANLEDIDARLQTGNGLFLVFQNG